jgi:hypothetical protein
LLFIRPRLCSSFQSNVPEQQQDPWLACKIGPATISFLIDSGAEVNTLSEADFEVVLKEATSDLSELRWGDSHSKLTAYAASQPLQIRATFWATIEPIGSAMSVWAKVHVIEGATKSLLGRTSATELGVLRVGLGIFECELKPQALGTGKTFPRVPGFKVRFDIDKTITPTKNSYYNVPAAFRDRARERLDEMESQGIIEKVTNAPRWISGMSLVPKGKTDFRLVVNMRGPNRAIRRAYHPLPTLEEIKVRLAGATVFSKLDITSAFYHLELDEDSRELTTFLTERGMRRFTRLVFGVNCAPEIFQRKMEQILEGLKGVVIFMDDILVFANSWQELSDRTAQVTSALKKNNLTINLEKSEYNKRSIKFLGHELSEEGFAIEEAKVRDVLSFTRPDSAKTLRSFLGLAAYLSDFIPRFADLTAPLWQLIKTPVFRWDGSSNNAFTLTKKAIANCTTRLGFFRSDWETILYTDASPEALGAVLVQEKKPEKPRIICFASKILTSTEKNYPQIQREALGIVWAVERFYFYLMGRRFTIRSDAKGLSFIFDREKTTNKRALNRAEGWALRLGTYDFKIEWIKGEDNIADAPSRLSTAEPSFTPEPTKTATICVLTAEPEPIGPLSVETVRTASKKDAELREVRTALTNENWPESLKEFSKISEELREGDGIILRLGAIVVPKALRKEVLQAAHNGHPGISGTKSILRKRAWWPGVNGDVVKFVQECLGCNLEGKAKNPVPMSTTELPAEPWEKLAIDFSGPHARCKLPMIVVLVDYFSRFLVAEFVQSTSMNHLEPVLSSMFNLLGNPKAIRSDNGPPFNGAAWTEFCSARGITAEFSTPGFPQQNGLAERNMQVINKAIAIACETNQCPLRSLKEAVAAHNSADHRTTGTAPEVALLGRSRRNLLPIIGKTMAEFDKSSFRARDETEKAKYRARENAKRKARDCDVKTGDVVLLKRPTRAKDQTKFAPIPYTVKSKSRGDYELEGPDGGRLTRNVTHMRKLTGSARKSRKDAGPKDPRPARPRKTPQHLSDFVLATEFSKE